MFQKQNEYKRGHTHTNEISQIIVVSVYDIIAMIYKTIKINKRKIFISSYDLILYLLFWSSSLESSIYSTTIIDDKEINVRFAWNRIIDIDCTYPFNVD